MRKANSTRLLLLKNLLFAQTDENNELSINDIQAHLIKLTKQSKLDVRTIKQDIESLQASDFDIVVNRKRHGRMHYSHQVKLFETYQIRLLIDAIISARFFSTTEKVRLINKLKQLTSVHIAKTFPEPLLYSEDARIDFDQMRFNIDKVHEAIEKNRILAFKYGSYNISKEFELRKKGGWYYVVPLALIWQRDQYYLIAESIEHEEIRHYRLDRMRETQITVMGFKQELNDVKEYVHSSFHMFGGKNTEIVMRFENELLNAIIDRFGKDANIYTDGLDHFILVTDAQVSQGLKSWILRWGSRLELLEPESLVKEIKEEVVAMYKTYN